jgi:hypothetical protein
MAMNCISMSINAISKSPENPVIPREVIKLNNVNVAQEKLLLGYSQVSVLPQ